MEDVFLENNKESIHCLLTHDVSDRKLLLHLRCHGTAPPKVQWENCVSFLWPMACWIENFVASGKATPANDNFQYHSDAPPCEMH